MVKYIPLYEDFINENKWLQKSDETFDEYLKRVQKQSEDDLINFRKKTHYPSNFEINYNKDNLYKNINIFKKDISDINKNSNIIKDEIDNDLKKQFKTYSKELYNEHLKKYNIMIDNVIKYYNEKLEDNNIKHNIELQLKLKEFKTKNINLITNAINQLKNDFEIYKIKY